jgi:hypothetical protein
MSVIVIGSGLSAIGVIKALRERGVKPMVLDIALSQEDNLNHLKHDLRSEVLLKKSNKSNLQHSNMKGGFSNVWGGSVLCPPKSELSDWPSKAIPTPKDYKNCTEGIVYTAADDDLASAFDHPHLNISNPPEDKSADYLIKKFSKLFKNKNLSFHFGRARQFIDYKNDNCIYSAKSEIEAMEHNHEITYISGADVQNIIEEDNEVIVEYICDKSKQVIKASSAFIASGAANTTKLLAKYCQLYDSKINLMYADSFVIPFFVTKNFFYDKNNTNSNIFFELNDIEKSNTFSHIQIGRPNEIILNLLKHRSLPNFLKKIVLYSLGFSYTAICTNHSKVSGYYETVLKKTKGNDNLMIIDHSLGNNQKRILKKVSKLLNSCGAYNLRFISKRFNAHFYIGGSFPMREIPTKPNETDVLGRPKGAHKIYAIDSSVFPSIPATTVGLLSMANGYRVGRLAEL